MNNQGPAQPQVDDTIFCIHCGAKIPAKSVFCTQCGGKVVPPATSQTPPIVINNSNVNSNQATILYGMAKSKWVAFFLCMFFGIFGVHKFYEGKAGMGILYFFTAGLLGIGVFIDLIVLLFKPNPYYVI